MTLPLFSQEPFLERLLRYVGPRRFSPANDTVSWAVHKLLRSAGHRS